MEIVKINSRKMYDTYKSYVEKFRDNLYLPSFPDPNEREPFEYITSRIQLGDSWWPRTDMLLYLDGEVVASGCITDYYPECRSIEAIYVVTDEKYRGQGLAKGLLQETFNLYPEALDLYLEADNPKFVPSKSSAIDPSLRIEIYQKLGFELLDFNYVQPPLAEGLDYTRNLILMCMSKEPLSQERLVAFLDSFYRGLDCHNSLEFDKMIKSIDPAHLFTPRTKTQKI